MSNSYTADSIQEMDPLTFCRHRPDTYLGSNENSTQLIREIVSNCSDEFLIGNCSEVTITYNEDANIVKVKDDGQGILPCVWKDDGSTILEQVYGRINTSGKYDKSENAVYKISTGAFGIGASLTNFLSHWLVATTYRDGKFEKVKFVEGKFSERECGNASKNKHGVEVEFCPSEEFFRNARPDIEQLKKELFDLSCVCAGLKFVFNGQEIYHPNGLADIVTREIGKRQELIENKSIFREQATDTQFLDFCMSFTDSSESVIVPFCNYGLIESGTPVTALKAALTRVFNNWGQEQGVIKNNRRLNGSDIQEGMVIAFNLVSQNVRYDSQTKVRATHTEDNRFISEAVSKNIEKWLDNNPDSGKIIIERAMLAKKAAEAAKKAREAVKQCATEKKDKVFKLPTKLTDCWGKDRSKCELLIAEGVSAASGLVAARDSEFQAVYGVRGKMLNVRKTAAKNIMKNQEINNIVVALGLDYNPVTGKMKYDPSKLRYGKIIACADADFDGFSIENLLFNILWYLCPELILNGHVYSSEPPLFKVTTKRNEYVYIRDDVELQQYKAKHKNIASIGRLKG